MRDFSSLAEIFYPSVLYLYYAVRILLYQIPFVRYHYHKTVGAQRLQQLHYRSRIQLVKIARRLVRQYYPGSLDHRSRYRYSLLLSSRQRCHVTLVIVPHSYIVQCSHYPVEYHFFVPYSDSSQSLRYVLVYVQSFVQKIVLEYIPYILYPVLIVYAALVDVAVHYYLSAVEFVQSAQRVHKRSFSRTARTVYGYKSFLGKLHAHVVDGAYFV